MKTDENKMNAKALILSDNERFSRMLSHELSYMRIDSECISDADMCDSCDGYDIILADLDMCGNGILSHMLDGKSVVRTEDRESTGVLVIGWSCAEDPELYVDLKLCSAYLRRPFLMADMRYIIAGYFSGQSTYDGSDVSIRDDSEYLAYISRLRRIAEMSGKRLDMAVGDKRRLMCDSDGMTAIYGEKRFPLSQYEYKVLSMLCERRGEIVTREDISRELGGEASNMCDVYICHLRKKIDSELGLKLILTVRGKGYCVK